MDRMSKNGCPGLIVVGNAACVELPSTCSIVTGKPAKSAGCSNTNPARLTARSALGIPMTSNDRRPPASITTDASNAKVPAPTPTLPDHRTTTVSSVASITGSANTGVGVPQLVSRIRKATRRRISTPRHASVLIPPSNNSARSGKAERAIGDAGGSAVPKRILRRSGCHAADLDLGSVASAERR